MERFGYKKKCYMIFGGFLLFIITAWNLSVTETLRQYDSIGTKEEKISLLKEREKELPLLQNKLYQLEKICKNEDSLSVRDRLTAFISDFAENNNCLVTEIPKVEIFKNAENAIETNIFVIKGSFKELLRLLQFVEYKFKSEAMLVSVRYFTLKNIQNKKKELFLSLTARSFTKLKNK